MMPLDTSIMWVGSLITIYIWSQIFALSGWMLIQYRHISSRNEVIDTACTMGVAALFIALQFIWSVRGLVACQGIGMEIGGDVFAFGAGYYIYRSLMGRHSFYIFAAQEHKRADDADAPIPS